MAFYLAKVQFEIDIDGKVKKQNKSYMVDAVSITDAEVQITKFLNKTMSDPFEIKTISESKIVDYINEK